MISMIVAYANRRVIGKEGKTPWHLPDDMRRRLVVKPGLTGLWQVSGRSNLSWEESIRLDLTYVENWSLAMDLAILARTVSAVVRSSGAY